MAPILKCQFYSRKRSERLYKSYRNISSGFGTKAKEYIFKKYGKKCLKCGSEEDIQIDHIIPVRYGFAKKIPLEIINNVDNLQVLCRSCNCRRSPDTIEDYRPK
jgi:5-methylcytosine-specific restriction endonuclease McrA